jgi:beta-galactosidase
MVYVCVPNSADNRRGGAAEHWNWPAGTTVKVACYTNCAEVELTLNGQSLGVKPATAAVEGVLTWSVPYEAGVLKAAGLKDGKPVCEFVLQTAGPANRIELLPGATQLAADGKDVCHVEYRIVDANGVRVPDAAQAVTFEVAGPAAIIGIGNGDLSNSEDPRGHMHQAYQGRGLAILQSKTAPGSITLKATAPNLAPATITLTSR